VGGGGGYKDTFESKSSRAVTADLPLFVSPFLDFPFEVLVESFDIHGNGGICHSNFVQFATYAPEEITLSGIGSDILVQWKKKVAKKKKTKEKEEAATSKKKKKKSKKNRDDSDSDDDDSGEDDKQADAVRYEDTKTDFVEMFYAIDKSRLSSRKGYVKAEDLSRTLKLNEIKLSDEHTKLLTAHFEDGGKVYYKPFADWLFLDKDMFENLHDRVRCSFIALGNRGVDLKRKIQGLDKKTRGTIPTRSFVKEVEKVGLPINSCELRALSFKYDERGDGEKFAYRRFLSHVTKRGDKTMQERDRLRKDHRRTRAKRTKQDKGMLIDSELQHQLHKMVLNQRKLTGEPDSILKEFRKVDPEDRSRVSKKDFAKLMKEWKVPLTDDEIDAIAKSFAYVDPDKDGAGRPERNTYINYQDFLVFAKSPQATSDQLQLLIDKLQTAEETKKEKTPSFEDSISKADKSGTGLLTKDQFKKAISNCGVKLSSAELATLVERFDMSSTKAAKISGEDFLAWLFPEKTILEGVERRLCGVFKELQRSGMNVQRVFKKMDKDGDGNVSQSEFRGELARMGVPINATEMRALLHRYDASKSGNFEYKEFLKLFDHSSKAKRANDKEDKKSRQNDSSESDTDGDDDDDDDDGDDPGSDDSGLNTDEENALEEEDSKWIRAVKIALKEAFDCVKIDGTIDRDELAIVARSMGQEIPDKDVASFFDEVDTDGDGTVSFKEFSAWMLPKLKAQYNSMDQEKEDRILEVFKLLDHDGSNSLDHAEFTTFLTSQQIVLNPKELSSLLKFVDRDGDGEIDFAEFETLINSFSNASPKERKKMFKPAVLSAVKKLCRGCVPDSEDYVRTFMHLPDGIRPSLLQSISERLDHSLQSVVLSHSAFPVNRVQDSSEVQMSFTIKQAKGVPVIQPAEDSPYDYEVLDRSILAVVCAHDGQSPSPVYLGNVYKIEASCDKKKSDRWVFGDSGTILVKAALPPHNAFSTGGEGGDSARDSQELFLLVEFHVSVLQTPRKEKKGKKGADRKAKREKKKKRDKKSRSKKKGKEDSKFDDGDSEDDRSDSDEEGKQNSDDSDDEGRSSRKSGSSSSKERVRQMCCGWTKIPLDPARVKTLPAEHTIFCGNPWVGDEVEVNSVQRKKENGGKSAGINKFFGGGATTKSVVEARGKVISQENLSFLPKDIVTRLDAKESLQVYNEYVSFSRKPAGGLALSSADLDGSVAKGISPKAKSPSRRGLLQKPQEPSSSGLDGSSALATDPTIKVYPQILGDASTFDAFKELVAKKGFMVGARKSILKSRASNSAAVREVPAYHQTFRDCVLAFWPAVSNTIDDVKQKQLLLKDCIKAGASKKDAPSQFSGGSSSASDTYTPFNIREVFIEGGT
jgi:Ca2+-binding EF-hand superfamily protein